MFLASLDWSRFLRPGESVLKQGPVLKPIRSARARCLILTDEKRMLYVEASTLQAKNLEFFADEDRSPQVLWLKKKKTFKVQVVIDSAADWVSAVKRAAEGVRRDRLPLSSRSSKLPPRASPRITAPPNWALAQADSHSSNSLRI